MEVAQQIERLKSELKALIKAEGIHRTYLMNKCDGDLRRKQETRIKKLRELYKEI